MFNVALIGIGNIGLLYDYKKSSKTSLSHAKAIFLNKNLNLKYAIDQSSRNLKKLKNLFPNIDFYQDVKMIKEKQDIDIVVIATNTNTHFSILQEFVNNKIIKLFLIEKPLFTKSDEYENLASHLKKKIVINYIRRFNKEFFQLQDEIKNKTLSKPMKMVFKYAKGFQNNGSHIIDLINYFFNDYSIQNIKILNSKNDYLPSDLTYDIYFELSKDSTTFPIYLIGLDEKIYSIFEAELFFENKKILISDFGREISYCEIIQDQEYPNYKILNPKQSHKKTHMSFILSDVYDQIIDIISHNKPNISSYDDEVKNKTMIKTILQKVNNG